MLKSKGGFTLIELVMIIVILGILAAIAVPRYADLKTDARASAVKGMEGAVRAAAQIVHARAILDNQTGATGSVTIEGTAIATAYGYPTNATIDDALNSLSGFLFTSNASPTPSTFDVDSDGDLTADPATPANCRVSYNQPTVADNPPTITVNVSNCS
jgi:MSHA pilin protein MshA